MVLGCDGAGMDEDGNEVVVHAVVGDPDFRGDETMDPRRTLLSEKYDGTLADLVQVPRRNLVPKPADLSFEEASCLPTELADGVPHALHPGRRAAGLDGPGAGRRRRRRRPR